jgi:hypothetical protein
MDIRPRSKAAVQAQLRAAMLSSCDPDIRGIFGEHFYTMEPLLLQIIRELKVLNGTPREAMHVRLEAVRAPLESA